MALNSAFCAPGGEHAECRGATVLVGNDGYRRLYQSIIFIERGVLRMLRKDWQPLELYIAFREVSSDPFLD